MFEGASFALNADGALAAQLPAFREAVALTNWVRTDEGWRCEGPIAPLEEGEKADYCACVLGLRDYVEKNGFAGVVFGLSGGIDSALCAAIAVDALGAHRVRAVMLPYGTRLRFLSTMRRKSPARSAFNTTSCRLRPQLKDWKRRLPLRSPACRAM